MRAFLKFHYRRDGRRQPEVAYVYYVPAVYAEVVPPCHFLAHIQQQRIASALLYLYLGLEKVARAHFLRAARGGSDIHYLAF